jgi:hypothetical protein
MKANALKRFVSIGLRDADARIGYALAPRSFKAVDHYLWNSWVVRTFDRATRMLRQTWLSSATRQTLSGAAEPWRQDRSAARYRSIAIMLLTAAGIHVVLTLAQGPRPGWFWLIVPALAAALAFLILAGSRTRTHH